MQNWRESLAITIDVLKMNARANWKEVQRSHTTKRQPNLIRNDFLRRIPCKSTLCTFSRWSTRQQKHSFERNLCKHLIEFDFSVECWNLRQSKSQHVNELANKDNPSHLRRSRTKNISLNIICKSTFTGNRQIFFQICSFFSCLIAHRVFANLAKCYFRLKSFVKNEFK